MNVAWGLCWEAGARNHVFPCKVAAGGDERYLLCAAVAAGVVSRSKLFSLGVLRRVNANRIVMAAWMGTCCCKTHCSGRMTGAWGYFCGGSRSRKPFFCLCVKWLQPAMNHTSCVCGGCGLDRFERNRFSLGILRRADANRMLHGWVRVASLPSCIVEELLASSLVCVRYISKFAHQATINYKDRQTAETI